MRIASRDITWNCFIIIVRFPNCALRAKFNYISLRRPSYFTFQMAAGYEEQKNPTRNEKTVGAGRFRGGKWLWVIRGNIHPQPSDRNSLAEEIKNSHPAPGPLMAGIVHVNMGHCPYYHITLRKAPAARIRRALLINTSNYKTGWFLVCAPLTLSTYRMETRLYIARARGSPLAISLTHASLSERYFF